MKEIYDEEYDKEEYAEAEESKRIYCPRWIDDDAKKEWRRLAPVLLKNGLLNEMTYNSLVTYCQEWSRYQKQQIFINNKGTVMKDGKGSIREIPQVAIAYKALRAMHRAAKEIGFGSDEGDD